MEVVKIFLRLATPVILLCILPHIHHAHAQSTDKMKEQMRAAQARSSAIQNLFQTGATKDMWMVVVCSGLQNMAFQCRTVQRFEQYFPNLPGVSGRRKRSWSSPYWNTGWNGWNNWNNWGNGWYNEPYQNYPNTNTITNTAVVCPSVISQSTVYNLSPNSANYPADNIGNALVQSPPALLACLEREIVLEGSPPTVLVDSFLTGANATCPFTQLRLWSYTSLTVGSTCFVLQNFQENVLYRECTERFCQNCVNPSTTPVNNLNQKLCITEYTTVSVWAYCESLPAGNQIIRDRIIIPFSCSCRSVRCTAALRG